ncbi:hypothetical protein KSF_107530 [Reticulibacter mediterranei]|uniref:Uncharacterized protein n=1 Tax=Reticulibacter mediterranei TaxID=2778369 RepID=A0A8J3N9K9_9CHLR|nr:hypothetical protein [Reticulibacter mediterranei]GHP00706.1 hypothetical protein KSF_107530 [Reticulibacter mediterranei]
MSQQNQNQTTYYLAYPPFACDAIQILTASEYWGQGLPANHHYEPVSIPGNFQSFAQLQAWVNAQNQQRY